MEGFSLSSPVNCFSSQAPDQNTLPYLPDRAEELDQPSTQLDYLRSPATAADLVYDSCPPQHATLPNIAQQFLRLLPVLWTQLC